MVACGARGGRRAPLFRRGAPLDRPELSLLVVPLLSVVVVPAHSEWNRRFVFTGATALSPRRARAARFSAAWIALRVVCAAGLCRGSALARRRDDVDLNALHRDVERLPLVRVRRRYVRFTYALAEGCDGDARDRAGDIDMDHGVRQPIAAGLFALSKSDGRRPRTRSFVTVASKRRERLESRPILRASRHESASIYDAERTRLSR